MSDQTIRVRRRGLCLSKAPRFCDGYQARQVDPQVFKRVRRLTFTPLLSFSYQGRAVEDLPLQDRQETRRGDAPKVGRLILRDGGRLLHLRSPDVILSAGL
jgi:hypothetical protein